ncbi:MAG: CHC2 zinc finger domain-containing protein [Geminicoccaceae bacterium]
MSACACSTRRSRLVHRLSDQGNYHCFGCGAHGTAIDFVMATEGLGFTEALRRLADLTGIPAPLREPAAGPGRPPTEPLVAANETAARWFQGRLPRAKAGSPGTTSPSAACRRICSTACPGLRAGQPRRPGPAPTAAGIPPAVQAEAGLVGLPEEGGPGL